MNHCSELWPYCGLSFLSQLRITTARLCLGLIWLTGRRRNKAEIHTVTASSSSSCSDWSLNWQNNACARWNNSNVFTGTCCVSCFRFCLLSTSLGRLKPPNLTIVSHCTTHIPAAPGFSRTCSTCRWTRRHQPDFWGKKPQSTDKPQREADGE